VIEIAFLNEWVKGLIVLLLLAGCLEMLVPSGAMKKYVRMTLGLFILLAVLDPIFSFIGQPVAVDTLRFFDQEQGGRLPTLHEVMARGTALRERNESLVHEQAAAKLAAQARDAALGIAGVKQVKAQVKLTVREGGIAISSVRLEITPGEPGGMSPVLPVDPVTPGRSGSDSSASSPSTSSPPTAGQPRTTPVPSPVPASSLVKPEPGNKLARDVRKAVAAELGISDDPDLIQVYLVTVLRR
jgi:stage III sporulation protein AF